MEEKHYQHHIGRPRKYTDYKVEYGKKVMLHCCLCNKVFERYSSTIRNSNTKNHKHFFCSKKCFGRWLGVTIGRYALEKYRETKEYGNVGYRYVVKCLKPFLKYELIKIKNIEYLKNNSKSLCCNSKVDQDYDTKRYYCRGCDKEVYIWNNPPIIDWAEELLGSQI